MNIILTATEKDTLLNIFNSLYITIMSYPTATDIAVYNIYNNQTTAEDSNKYVIRVLSSYNKIGNQVLFTYSPILEINNILMLKNAIKEFNYNMGKKIGKKKIYAKLINYKYHYIF